MGLGDVLFNLADSIQDEIFEAVDTTITGENKPQKKDEPCPECKDIHIPCKEHKKSF